MQYRHEVKLPINSLDVIVLRQRLKAILKPDSHAKDGSYSVRSLYFDDPDDSALKDKLDGVAVREKYRIRMYNYDESFIRLERKFKSNGVGFKNSAQLTKEQTLKILQGDILFLADSDNEVMNDFYKKLIYKHLRPKVLVDYKREPYVFTAGNVRVTIDSDIRTSLNCIDFFSKDTVSLKVQSEESVLEIKWDNYLPDIVKAAVTTGSLYQTAFSKYAMCRMYE